MKQLRKTIRRILLENQQHFEKLAKMIATGEKESIIQALELAEAVGYIGFTEQSEPRKWYANEDIFFIKYSCNDCDLQFIEEVEKQYYEEQGKRIVPLFSIEFFPKRAYFAISLGEVTK